MKILIKESALKHILNELFEGHNLYDFNLIGKEEFGGDGGKMKKIINHYNFVTKDDVEYRVDIMVREDKLGKADFYAKLPDGGGVSLNFKIDKYDSIKVFNTILEIILQHKREIKRLVMSSFPERSQFYEKLLNYRSIPYERINNETLIASI